MPCHVPIIIRPPWTGTDKWVWVSAARKWAGMKKALKPEGLLLLIGYTPKQLQHGTGGPKEIEQLYTRALLEKTFGGFRDLTIVEEELDMHEASRMRACPQSFI